MHDDPQAFADAIVSALDAARVKACEVFDIEKSMAEIERVVLSGSIRIRKQRLAIRLSQVS